MEDERAIYETGWTVTEWTQWLEWKMKDWQKELQQRNKDAAETQRMKKT